MEEGTLHACLNEIIHTWMKNKKKFDAFSLLTKFDPAGFFSFPQVHVYTFFRFVCLGESRLNSLTVTLQS